MGLPFSKRGARPRTGLNIAFCTALRPQTRNGTRQPLLSRFSLVFCTHTNPTANNPTQKRNAFKHARSTDLAKAKGETEGGATACTPNNRQAKTPEAPTWPRPKEKRRGERQPVHQTPARANTWTHKFKRKRHSCKQKHKPKSDQMLSHVYGYVFSGAKH